MLRHTVCVAKAEGINDAVYDTTRREILLIFALEMRANIYWDINKDRLRDQSPLMCSISIKCKSTKILWIIWSFLSPPPSVDVSVFLNMSLMDDWTVLVLCVYTSIITFNYFFSRCSESESWNFNINRSNSVCWWGPCDTVESCRLTKQVDLNKNPL